MTPATQPVDRSAALQQTPLEVGRQVIAEEAAALRAVAESLGSAFERVVQTILSDCDQLVISGLGKSGVIAQKIAASLTSTGTPATYLHPVEALHGDLGVVSRRHGLLALTRSGNTDELLRLVTHFRRLGGPVIGVTQARGSRLEELSHHVLLLPDLPEAGPMKLAPTTSCVMQLAIGDALAMALLHQRGFREENFAQYHPEGTLGRRLLLRAADLMHAGDALPLVRADQPLVELLHEATRKQLGLALIVDADGALVGTFTDGDLRRLAGAGLSNPFELDARTAHARSRRPVGAPPPHASCIAPTRLAIDCLQIMRDSQITTLVVADEQHRPVGVLRLMDLLRAGIG
ncbi:MAG: KpsF/GutQ family sugar-phosphate isomerase [Phycisphaerales bacterium]|nr:KpsF/GutQ family sugar-phosphate isomerase [Phycisphaerales bacterium]